MIFNKVLNITEEDIVSQDDIEILSQWRNSLDSQLTSLLSGVDSLHELPKNKKIAYKYLFTLRKIVYRRIGECRFKIRQETGWISERNQRKYRSLSMVFMRIAKQELSKDEYNRLLAIAQSDTQE